MYFLASGCGIKIITAHISALNRKTVKQKCQLSVKAK